MGHFWDSIGTVLGHPMFHVKPNPKNHHGLKRGVSHPTRHRASGSGGGRAGTVGPGKREPTMPPHPSSPPAWPVTGRAYHARFCLGVVWRDRKGQAYSPVPDSKAEFEIVGCYCAFLRDSRAFLPRSAITALCSSVIPFHFASAAASLAVSPSNGRRSGYFWPILLRTFFSIGHLRWASSGCARCWSCSGSSGQWLTEQAW